MESGPRPVKALIGKFWQLPAILLAALCALSAAKGVDLLGQSREASLFFLALSMLPLAVFLAITSHSVLNLWVALLPFTYQYSTVFLKSYVHIGWMVIFVILLILELFGTRLKKRLSTVELLHMTAILAFVFLGFGRSSGGRDAWYLMIGNYLLPLFVYLGIRMLPRNTGIENILPRCFILSWALIGVGSLLYKATHLDAERVAGFVPLAVTMIGYSAATLIPVALHYLRVNQKVRLEGMLLFLIMICLLLTNSRMALPMAAIGLFIGRDQLKRFMLPVMIIGGLIAVLGVGLVFTRYANMAESAIDYSTAARAIAWMSGLKLLLSNPLTGIGLGEFSEAYLRITAFPLIELRHAHNALLQLIMDLGIPGAFIYLTFIGRRLLAGLKKTQDGLGRALFWSLSIWLLSGAIDSIFYLPEWTLFYWALLACLDRHVDQQAEDEAAEAAVQAPAAG
jgi:O-antigen ligase